MDLLWLFLGLGGLMRLWLLDLLILQGKAFCFDLANQDVLFADELCSHLCLLPVTEAILSLLETILSLLKTVLFLLETILSFLKTILRRLTLCFRHGFTLCLSQKL